jgi:exosortase
LAFLIVPPGSIVTELTQPLKIWISLAAVELLYFLDYPVAHSGAIIHIAQYDLLVETACAGLGSLLSLTAISLLYIHLRWDAGVVRSALLMAAVVPIAIFANFVRVLVLVLLTYYGGDQLAQGFAHDFAGLLLFVVAMLGMFAVDKLLSLTMRRPVEQMA